MFHIAGVLIPKPEECCTLFGALRRMIHNLGARYSDIVLFWLAFWRHILEAKSRLGVLDLGIVFSIESISILQT